MEIEVHAAVSGAPPVRRVRKLLERLGRLLPPSASGLPSRGLELSVLLCGDARMRSLNRRYRGKNRSTDVLAFPGHGRALGDIVISVPYAAREARRRGASRAQEVDRLLLHGFLHLLGYDHEVDHGEMDALEARMAGRLGLPPGEREPSAARSSR